MNEELSKKLTLKYPKLFRKINTGEEYTEEDKYFYSFACGNGWYTIIDELCASIEQELEFRKIDDLCVLQVKEKFGGLRFYTNISNDVITGMIMLAEGLSYRTCEVCGTTKNVGWISGWITTLCFECAAEEGKLDHWYDFKFWLDDFISLRF